MNLPTATQLKPHVLEAISELGGRADNAAMAELIADKLNLTQESVRLPHDPARGKRTEFAYRLAWTRTRLVKDGLIERVGSGVWRLTTDGPDYTAQVKSVEAEKP